MTLFIIHVGYGVTSQLAHHIMDGVDVEDCQAARVAAQSVPGVESAAVRGRWTGRSLILEVEGRVRSDLTVAEAERVGSQVEEAVFGAVEAVRQVRWTARPGTAT